MKSTAPIPSHALPFADRIAADMDGTYRKAHSTVLENGYFAALMPLLQSMTHALSDLLIPICEYPALIQRILPNDSPALELSERISLATERLYDMNLNLIRLCHGHHDPPADVDLPALAKGVLADLTENGTSIPAAQILVETEAPPLALHASYEALYHLMREMFLNAFAALKDGGTLLVRIGGLDVDQGDAFSLLGVAPGPHLCLQFRDDGPGIDERFGETLFDPFVSSNPGEGLGLGLSAVYRTVRSLRGCIVHNLSAGSGGDFILLFPRTPP